MQQNYVKFSVTFMNLEVSTGMLPPLMTNYCLPEKGKYTDEIQSNPDATSLCLN